MEGFPRREGSDKETSSRRSGICNAASPRPDCEERPMPPASSVLDAIGNTPLIKLRRASEATGCTILGKAEFMNPGGSVKDRAGLAIIQDAVQPRRIAQTGWHDRRGYRRQHRHRPGARRQRARLQDGDRDPGDAEPRKEGHAAAAGRRADRGACRPVFQSEQLREDCPAASRSASRTELPGWRRSGRTSSTTSPTAKVTGSPQGPKSGATRAATVNGFTCAVGTGGTLAGVAMALKAENPDDQDCNHRSDGLGALRLITRAASCIPKARRSRKGIGQGRLTANLEDAPIDLAYRVTDEDALADRVRPRGA